MLSQRTGTSATGSKPTAGCAEQPTALDRQVLEWAGRRQQIVDNKRDIKDQAATCRSVRCCCNASKQLRRGGGHACTLQSPAAQTDTQHRHRVSCRHSKLARLSCLDKSGTQNMQATLAQYSTASSCVNGRSSIQSCLPPGRQRGRGTTRASLQRPPAAPLSSWACLCPPPAAPSLAPPAQQHASLRLSVGLQAKRLTVGFGA